MEENRSERRPSVAPSWFELVPDVAELRDLDEDTAEGPPVSEAEAARVLEGRGR